MCVGYHIERCDPLKNAQITMTNPSGTGATIDCSSAARHTIDAASPDRERGEMSVTERELFAPPRVVQTRRPDGTILLRSSEPLGDGERSMAHAFMRGAREHPDRILAGQRDGDGWRTISWGDAARDAGGIAEWLLGQGLGPHLPVMVLSGNSIEHLLVMLGAFHAGIPVLPISTAYSLLSRDHERIRRVADLCEPGLVFADDADAYRAALDAVAPVVPLQAVARGKRAGAVPLAEMAATPGGRAAAEALSAVGPDTVAKILFTSGSTGVPKGVVNTHRMLCSNQQALGQIWPFLSVEPPTLVDWLPWSHTFGGNHNLNQVLTYGGTLFIDDGRPAGPLFDRTVEALRHAQPTVYYNVPAGFALLAPRLEEDREFAEAFFSRLRFMFYAAAALPRPLWSRLRAVADEVADHPVPLTASWGTTETAPAATSAHFAAAQCGCIGVPIPGVTLKLVPNGDKREIRVLGPNVTPGYYRDPEATAAAFDDEGFYCTGDAGRFVDDRDPALGLLFDGRLSEDFKLVTGTWVHVGAVRIALVAGAGVLSDAVICGHDRAFVAALAWLNQVEAKRVLGRHDDVPLDDPALVGHLAAALSRMNSAAGSATRIERLLLLSEPPDIDAGEITDKGYINQRAVLTRRTDAVSRLFAEPPAVGVITPSAT
jgi:feruloyl-CoA synthase